MRDCPYSTCQTPHILYLKLIQSHWSEHDYRKGNLTSVGTKFYMHKPKRSLIIRSIVI